ncbi:MAG: hypothetical protein ABSE48_22155 [Verrucomicrobiota bacterium]
MNPLKHGTSSTDILAGDRLLQANPEEFAQLHQSMCDACDPVRAAEVITEA